MAGYRPKKWKRQRRQRGQDKAKARLRYRKNRSKNRMRAKKRYKQIRKNPAFKRRKQLYRRNPSKSRRLASLECSSEGIEFVRQRPGGGLESGCIVEIDPWNMELTLDTESGRQTADVDEFLARAILYDESDVDRFFDMLDCDQEDTTFCLEEDAEGMSHLAFNKENPSDLLSQVVKVLGKAESSAEGKGKKGLQDASSRVRGLAKLVAEAWLNRKVAKAEGTNSMSPSTETVTKLARQGTSRTAASTGVGSVEHFLQVLISKLTQYDKRQMRGKYYNPNALALYFDASEKVRAALAGSWDSSEEADLLKLKKALSRFFTGDFSPAKAVKKQIDQFLSKGTRPSLTRRSSMVEDLGSQQGKSMSDSFSKAAVEQLAQRHLKMATNGRQLLQWLDRRIGDHDLVVDDKVRIYVGKGAREGIFIVEVPMSAKPRKKGVAYVNVDYALRASGMKMWPFIASNLAQDAKFSKSDDYSTAVRKLSKALEVASEKAQELNEADISRWAPTLDQGQVDYLEIPPKDAKPFTVKGKDFSFEVAWASWSFTRYDSDPNDMEPSYTRYVSKSPAAARKLFKMLKAQPDALKSVPESKFSEWLDKNKIKYSLQFSVWR